MAKKPLIPYKWEMIILLWFAYFFNQGDRQIYNVVLPLIKNDLLLSDVQLGLVVTIFTLCYAVLVPIAGYVGDIYRRKWVVFFSLLIWSTATLFTGISTGIVILILFRGVATGGGEAFYYPAANSLIGQYHHKTRALAMSIHQTSLYAGIVVSGFIAGFIGEHFGWRMAFYLFGILGILLAVILYFRLEDTPQPNHDPENTDAASERIPISTVLKTIARKPTALMLCLAFGGMVFVNIGFMTWMPTYLHEDFSLSLTMAGFDSTFYHYLFAFFGVLLGGQLSDYLAQKRRTIRMETECLGLLLGAPFIYLMGATDNILLCYVAMAAFGLFRGIYDSNLFAALFDVIEPRVRASAVG
ncbi:MFS transporter, partial [bacterium]|nr:MFS transporter [bacterium]